MSNFVTLRRRYPSSLEISKRIVEIVEEKKDLGIGGCMCTVKKPDGVVLENEHLSITTKNQEQIIILGLGSDAQIVTDLELQELQFKFSNFD